MACSCNSFTLAGLCKDCEGNVGGISVVYVALASEISAVTVDSSTGETGGMITAITLTNTGTTPFYEYQFKKNTGSMTSTLNVTDQGDTYVETVLSLIFNRMETKKRIEMNALSVQDLVIIVKDCNSKYWYLGYDNPVSASNGGGETGTNRTDSNHYSLELTDTSASYPYEVLGSIVDSLVTKATN